MQLALAQMTVIGGEPERNLANARSKIAEAAAAAGADVVLLPEALDLGWTHPSARENKKAGSIPGGEAFQQLADAARQEKIWVCAGLIEREDGGDDRLFNSAVLIDSDGELRLKHRKIHELDIALDLYTPGDPDALAVCEETPFGIIGVSLCADGFAPDQWIHRRLCELGARIILSPCAWAVPPDHDNNIASAEPYGELWRENYRPVAIDHGAWIAGCSCVGSLDSGAWAGWKCIGNSLVISPDGGEVLIGPHGEDADTLMTVEIPV